SSRRRHTRSDRDWSSDVCSSDLVGHGQQVGAVEGQLGVELVAELVTRAAVALTQRVAALDHEAVDDPVEHRAVVERLGRLLLGRSEERRVGAEWWFGGRRGGWAT